MNFIDLSCVLARQNDARPSSSDTRRKNPREGYKYNNYALFITFINVFLKCRHKCRMIEIFIGIFTGFEFTKRKWSLLQVYFY